MHVIVGRIEFTIDAKLLYLCRLSSSFYFVFYTFCMQATPGFLYFFMVFFSLFCSHSNEFGRCAADKNCSVLAAVIEISPKRQKNYCGFLGDGQKNRCACIQSPLLSLGMSHRSDLDVARSTVKNRCENKSEISTRRENDERRWFRVVCTDIVTDTLHKKRIQKKSSHKFTAQLGADRSNRFAKQQSIGHAHACIETNEKTAKRKSNK